jgi:ABC-2 type transport system ATP-binding protein
MSINQTDLPVLQTDALTRRFGAFTAVDGLNLEVRQGETYGFLGPNGAGKTTTLMMLAGVLRPTSGEVRLFGKRLSDDPFALKRRVGVVIEAQSYYDEMTAWEYLTFFARLYRAQDASKRGQTLLERLGLWEWRDTIIGGFSTGMQRKLALVRALLHAPELLILDEPVASLDPFSVKQVRELLLDEHAAGRTILISSHILSEIEHDRPLVSSRAAVSVEDTMSSLGSRLARARSKSSWWSRRSNWRLSCQRCLSSLMCASPGATGDHNIRRSRSPGRDFTILERARRHHHRDEGHRPEPGGSVHHDHRN